MSVEQLHPVVDAYKRMCAMNIGLCHAIMDVIADLEDEPRDRLSGALRSAAAQTGAIEDQLAAALGGGWRMTSAEARCNAEEWAKGRLSHTNTMQSLWPIEERGMAVAMTEVADAAEAVKWSALAAALHIIEQGDGDA